MRIKMTLSVCVLSLLLSGSVSVAGTSAPLNDTPSAPPVEPTEPPALGYWALHPGSDGAPVAVSENITNITPMAESEPIQAGECWYSQETDNPHISSTAPLATSVHGWWNRLYLSNCPSKANVDTYLQGWWCDFSCRWITVASASGDVFAGGGSGRWVTAREPCSSTKLVSWRGFVDVDLIGVWDPPGYTYSSIVDLNCEPTG